MKAIVLCAGHGTRLGELTKKIPKPMLPVYGKPLLAYTLRHLASYGFSEIAINLHFQPEQIVEYFGDGSKYGLSIHYSYEPQLLGTAGAVKNLESWLEDVEIFLVLYGDILTDQDLAQLWKAHSHHHGLGTLLLHQRTYSNSLVQMDDDNLITAFVERPSEEQRKKFPYPWVYSGVQVLNRNILDFLPANQALDLPKDLFVKLVEIEKFFGFPLSGFRCAVDSPSRYFEAETAVREGQYQPKFLSSV